MCPGRLVAWLIIAVALAVIATPARSGAPAPVLQSAVSRMVHGAAGTFDMPVLPVPNGPATEPRRGTSQSIVFTFDKPINAATVTVTEGTATAGAPAFNGNDAVVVLTGVLDRQYVTVTLSNVTAVDGGTGGGGSAQIGFLTGDVNQTRVVTLTDLGLVNSQLAQIATATNYLKDVNASGTITLTDKGITNANLTMALPPPAFVLAVDLSGSGTGTMASAPAGIACGADCTESYAAGTVVTLTATPGVGSTFSSWSGACSGSGACVVIMDAAKSVTASFGLTVCDTGLPSNSTIGLDYAAALDLCEITTETGTAPGVISAVFTLASGAGSPAAISRAIRGAFGTGNVPIAGTAMVVLSTGAAASTGQTNPGFMAFQLGTDTATASTAPADWLAANGGAFPHLAGCPAASSATANNPVMLTLRIRVPSNAHSFSLSARFFAADFPEFVCSPYNDVFVALLDSTYAGTPPNPADKNLATHTAGAVTYPLGVNLAVGSAGLFTQCANGATGCGPGAIPGSINSCTSTTALAATGMDLNVPTCAASAMTGGGTDWLEIRGNVVPGEVIQLRLALWDTADGTYDSVVLLDNFAWSPSTVTPGTFSK